MIEAARRKPAPAADISADAQPFRVPPHSLDAEQALLGAILVNNEAHDRVSSFLEAHHFFDPLHQQIYDTTSKLIGSGKQANGVTLQPFFGNAEPIDATTTVVQYLGKLAVNATTIINARDYGRTVHDLYTRRQLIIIGEDVVNRAYNSPVDFPPKEQIEEVEKRLFSLVEHGERGQEVDFSAAVEAAVQSVRSAHRGGSVGLLTKLRDLDARMGGLHPSDLIIAAGRPAMGKSVLATTIAHNVAEQGVPVAFYSLEMNKDQVATRIICACAGVPMHRATRGELDDEEQRRFEEAAAHVSPLPIPIDETGGISIAKLAARARRQKRKKGIGLIIIDYLQLMTGTSRRGDGRVQEVGEITTGLKALAKELHVPVLALFQLNRAVENREDKRPQLNDLRESGSIEQDADVVLFLYREEYYLERLKPQEGTPEFHEWSTKMQEAAGKAEIIISKQRHGPVGKMLLQFDGPCMRFADIVRPNTYADEERR